MIEVKSFVGRSPMREFQTALGQYLIYRTFIEQTHADYKIYLAVNFLKCPKTARLNLGYADFDERKITRECDRTNIAIMYKVVKARKVL